MTSKRKMLEIGGVIAGLILVAFGVGSLVMGVQGRSTVNDSLKHEFIVGTPDMTPAGIKAEALKSGLTLSKLQIPTCSVANQAIDNGSRARCFAQYMRIHAFEATGGYTYAQMGRYQALANAPKSAIASPGATNDPKYAVTDAKTHQPVDNGVRNLWVTETALTTALNTSYMASQLGLFALVVGTAFLLSGIGFLVLALGGALRRLAPKAEARSTQPVTA